MRSLSVVLVSVLLLAARLEAQGAQGIQVVTRAEADGVVVARALCFSLEQGADNRGATCPIYGQAFYTWYLGTCSADSCSWRILNVPQTASAVVLRRLQRKFLYRLVVTVPWTVNAGQALYRP